MSCHDFPKIKWGICPICGANGADQAEDLSSADAPARDTEGNGVRLEYYRGQLGCEICIKELKADEESERAALKHRDKDRFMAGAGFVDQVDDE